VPVRQWQEVQELLRGAALSVGSTAVVVTGSGNWYVSPGLVWVPFDRSRPMRPFRNTPVRTSSGRIVSMDLDSPSGLPLYRRIAAHIGACIDDGRLAPNSPVPSTRALARELRVSRSTVVLAYEELQAEGYVISRMGAATRVRPQPSDMVGPALPGPEPAPTRDHGGRPSRRALEVARLERHSADFLSRGPRAFRSGVPAVDTFPFDIWGRLMTRRWQRVPAKALGYGDVLGFRPLREAIAEYVGVARGVRCGPDQIMIVPGSQFGVELACRVLLDPGDLAWMEDPGYHGARGAMVSAGARIVPVPVDDEGMHVEEGLRLAADARLAYVTPSRQLPLGVTMSVARRKALVAWARQAGGWIVEDDYDSEFRYSTRPVQALQGMGAEGLVVYAGTFSKVTFPAVRLGYLVLPHRLLDAFAAARTFTDVAVPYLTQAVMTDFMTEGHFERHIRRMRTVYQERQALLVQLADQELSHWMRVDPSDAGMTLIGWLERRVDDVAVARQAAKRNIDLLALSSMAVNRIRPGVLLGYAGVREHEIRDGVGRLAVLFRALERAGGLPQRTAWRTHRRRTRA
jgi:GntR family transcriptional regulator / MocR family aminotransferase